MTQTTLDNTFIEVLCFTVNECEDHPDLKKTWKTFIENAWKQNRFSYIIAQLERGEETGHIHIQGYAELHKKARRITIKGKKYFNTKSIDIRKRQGTQEQAINYCIKEDTRIDDYIQYGEARQNTHGKRTDIHQVQDEIKLGTPLIELMDKYPIQFSKYYKYFTNYKQLYEQRKYKEQLELKYNKPLRDWQVQATMLIQLQTDRQIHIFIDRIGNTGKTWLTTYLHFKKNAYCTEISKKEDIAHAYNFEEWILYDLPRSYNEDHLNYGLIEKFKDGKIFSPKYDSKTKYRPDCKVAIFTNNPIDTSKFSADRPQVYEIKYDKLFKQHKLVKYKSEQINEQINTTNYDDDLDYGLYNGGQ